MGKTKTTKDTLDLECFSATLVDHKKDHKTDLDSHSAASLRSSIFHKINPETNESIALTPLQTEEFTVETLKSFIRKIWLLKNERKLADDTAVSALSLLLPEVACKWWEDTKPFVTSWQLAVALLVKVLDDKRTLSDAWQELETSHHHHDRHLLAFLNEQRILVAEIRQFKLVLTEQMEIDLVYHKLNSAIKKKLDRRKITSFAELIRRAQLHGLMECDVPALTIPCVHCKQLGHREEQCIEKKYEDERDEQIQRYRSSVIPSISMKVNGIPDYVHLASDSYLNVITDRLYGKLLQRGCLFESSNQVVSTVNSARMNALQMATVIVECNHHLIVAPVVKLQNSRGNKNCFGMSFIESCDLLSYLGCE